jgi:hypothetical protein
VISRFPKFALKFNLYRYITAPWPDLRENGHPAASAGPTAFERGGARSVRGRGSGGGGVIALEGSDRLLFKRVNPARHAGYVTPVGLDTTFSHFSPSWLVLLSHTDTHFSRDILHFQNTVHLITAGTLVRVTNRVTPGSERQPCPPAGARYDDAAAEAVVGLSTS